MGNLRGVSAVSDAQAGKVEEGSGRAGEIRRIAKIAEIAKIGNLQEIKAGAG
jgi:hypothetical protein